MSKKEDMNAGYFIYLIKSYLQGTLTKAEVKEQTADLIDWNSELAVNDELACLLVEIATGVNAAFYDAIIEEVSESRETIPSRAGLIHHLEQYLAGNITINDLIAWATWHNVEDYTLADIFHDYLVAFLCIDFLPSHHQRFDHQKYKLLVEILKQNKNDPEKEKATVMLLLDAGESIFRNFLHKCMQPCTTINWKPYLLNKPDTGWLPEKEFCRN